MSALAISREQLMSHQEVRYEPAISIDKVCFVYPDGSVGIDDLSLQIAKGQIFGLLGPNGAGKSTLIRLMCGLLRPTFGHILIEGINPHKNPRSTKEKLCALLQNTPMEPTMRVREVLELFSKFYRNPSSPTELLERVGLSDKSKTILRKLSGGQKQRLAIARSLIGNPQILVLDEPTAGLDAAIRHELLDLIQTLRADGRTILISTHYIEEAEQSCDVIAMLRQGKLCALGSPQYLVRKFGDVERLEVTLSDPYPCERLMSISGVKGVHEVARTEDGVSYVLVGDKGEDMLQQLVLAVVGADIRLQEARVIRRGLEGAYLQLTGERTLA